MSLHALLPEPGAPPAGNAPFRVHPLWAIGIFLVTLLTYALFTGQILLYTNPPTGDQPFYLHTAISIVQDHDIDEANNYANEDERLYYPRVRYPADFKGILAPFPLPPHRGSTVARPASESYSKHGLGLSVLIAPGWALGVTIPPPFVDLDALDQPTGGWPMVMYEMEILGALLAVQIFLLAYETARRPGIALAVWAALAFSNPQMTYSYLIFPELPAGLCTVYVFRRLALGWNSNGPWRLLLMGICIGFLPWLHARFLPISGGLALFALWSWWRARHPVPAAPAEPAGAPVPAAPEDPVSWRRLSNPAWAPYPAMPVLYGPATRPARPPPAPSTPPTAPAVAVAPARRSVLSLLVAAVPVGVALGLLMWYYYWLYGTVLPNTGDHAGFIDPRSDPFGLPVSMLGLLFDQQWGLLMAAPIYVLAFVGLVALWGAPRKHTLAVWLLICIVPYYLLVAEYRQWWGEWCPPARYLATLTPLLALPLAQTLLVLRRSTVYKVVYGLLTVVGWGVMAGLLAHPRSFWNDPTGQSNLLAWINTQFHVNLVSRLPAVVPWSWNHAQPMRWDLLFAWTGVALTVVIGGVLLVQETRAEIDRRLSFRNYRVAPDP